MARPLQCGGISSVLRIVVIVRCGVLSKSSRASIPPFTVLPAGCPRSGLIHRKKHCDREMMDMIEQSAFAAIVQLDQPLKRLFWFLRAKGDPNDWRSVRRNAFGVRYLPLTTSEHQRFGSRERLLDIAARYPEKLHIELDALASRIIFDADHRAVGVEYLKGKNLYRAHDQANENSGQQRQVKATREVILCGGEFNTTQLLIL